MTARENIPASQNPEHLPSLWLVNTFLLLGLCFILWVSSHADALPQFVVSILGEAILALVVIVLLRVEKLPVRETLRLRWPGWQPVVLGIIIALGMWIFGVAISVLATLILGYSPPASPESFPQTIWGALSMLVATTIAAPICEEIMFRGYVQRAYSRWGTWIGILACSAIFVLYHLRFLGLLGLLPIALILSLVAWRSHSLLPGIAMHAVYNGLASIVLIVNSFSSWSTVVAVMGGVICLSLAMGPLALAALWLFWQYTHEPARPAWPKPHGWRRWVWIVPLLAVFVIYGYAAFVEILLGRFPEFLAVEVLELQSTSASPLGEEPRQWQYEIRTTFNEVIGTAACSLTPQDTLLQMHCQVQHDAFADVLPFEIPALIATESEEGFWNHDLTWTQDTLQLVTLHRIQGVEGAPTVTWTFPDTDQEARLIVSQEDATQEMSLTAATLLQDEWPWRLETLPFEIGYGSHVPFVWVDEIGKVRQEQAYVGVVGGEPVWTPAGNFIAWKVILRYQTAERQDVELAAWYDIEVPHTLVRYDDGTVSYLLLSVE